MDLCRRLTARWQLTATEERDAIKKILNENTKLKEVRFFAIPTAV